MPIVGLGSNVSHDYPTTSYGGTCPANKEVHARQRKADRPAACLVYTPCPEASQVHAIGKPSAPMTKNYVYN